MRTFLSLSFGVFVAACAQATTIVDDTTDDGGTPQQDTSSCSTMCGGQCADLKTDNNNCGKCSNVCPMTATCVQGSCQCPSGQTRCNNNCVDTKTDNTNCGKCANICGQDAGAILGGGMWACTNATCGVVCPMPKAYCDPDGCVDQQSDNNNCGSCGNACAQMTEQCMQGQCCKTNEKVCNMMCTDVTSDNNNCGMCGKMCSGQTPYCVGGVCGSGVVFSQMFTSGQASPQQCTAWNTFRTALSGNYNSITMKGSNDNVGLTCTGNAANQLCQALHNGTTLTVACNNQNWSVGNCTGIELTATGPFCNCNATYVARPCINNLNWGGIKGNSSCSQPSQTITVICQ
jgi:hypothetical protein